MTLTRNKERVILLKRFGPSCRKEFSEKYLFVFPNNPVQDNTELRTVVISL